MIQQVNLCPESKKSTTRLVLNAYVLAVAAACFSFATISLLSWRTIVELGDQSRQLQQQLQTATAELLRSQARAPAQQDNAVLNQELQQAQTRIQSLSQIVELLADNQSDLTQGFSRYLAALANQSDSKVWLNSIQIDATTNHISLQGNSFKPEAIPTLLQRLQQTEPFKARHFARMNIQQATDQPELTDFSVSSNPEAEQKNAIQH